MGSPIGVTVLIPGYGTISVLCEGRLKYQNTVVSPEPLISVL